jgi:hypothetical protein
LEQLEELAAPQTTLQVEADQMGLAFQISCFTVGVEQAVEVEGWVHQELQQQLVAMVEMAAWDLAAEVAEAGLQVLQQLLAAAAATASSSSSRGDFKKVDMRCIWCYNLFMVA